MRDTNSTNSMVLCRQAICVLLVAFGVAFQLPVQTEDTPAAVVAFTLDFPGSEPEHYAVSVDLRGHAVYESNGKLTDQSNGDPFRLEFQVSEPTRAKIFDLAGRAHNFEGQVDSGNTSIANTGKKTISYKDGSKNTQATYNYSLIRAVQDITALFQNLSTTLEFGRRLEFYRRYQKLALDDELKIMDEMARDKNLAELPAVAPILKTIMLDTSLMRTTRVRASRLLDMANGAVGH